MSYTEIEALAKGPIYTHLEGKKHWQKMLNVLETQSSARVLQTLTQIHFNNM